MFGWRHTASFAGSVQGVVVQINTDALLIGFDKFRESENFSISITGKHTSIACEQ